MKKIMALDLGDARIGVAMSDMMGIIANGYETYHRVELEKDLDHIAALVKEFGVTVVVLGLP
ncbi:MAG: Holliday junction resolvase RuvX, partial [Clostridia bacterium]